jgi:hypothetical protein
MPKSKAEAYKEEIMSAVEDETESRGSQDDGENETRRIAADAAVAFTRVCQV